jgi:hypothetical protein
MKTFNLVQLTLWAIVVILGLGVGLPDLLLRSFFPSFSSSNFGLFFFSLTIIACIMGSCPILYLWFEKKDVS